MSKKMYPIVIKKDAEEHPFPAWVVEKDEKQKIRKQKYNAAYSRAHKKELNAYNAVYQKEHAEELRLYRQKKCPPAQSKFCCLEKS